MGKWYHLSAGVTFTEYVNWSDYTGADKDNINFSEDILVFQTIIVGKCAFYPHTENERTNNPEL